jgi:hypothetical protein
MFQAEMKIKLLKINDRVLECSLFIKKKMGGFLSPLHLSA